MDAASQPLEGALAGLRVLDFQHAAARPAGTLLLAECGAEVAQDRAAGWGRRDAQPRAEFGGDSAAFALLNRGKRSVAIDLKLPSARAQLLPLLESADVLIEQFRPGVMERLGFGYDSVRAVNPRLVYCSITGYGQAGARAEKAGHDLNYLAEAGLLSLAAGTDGAPAMPAGPVADLAGGSYPAVLNILLALQRRARTGTGCRLDIAMADNLFPFMYAALARGFAADDWPAPGPGAWSNASRYRCYRTLDGRYAAVAAVEEQFWRNFCAAIGVLPAAASAGAVAAVIATRTAAEWERAFAGQDVLVSIVRSVEEAVRDPIVQAEGLFRRTISAAGRSMPALPLPVAAALRQPAGDDTYPRLGEANALLGPAP
jgi:crotonobetainyl-CoA:carnitine CoA-transferase CaiB-like acyl-CoA transferase